jgi:hypothetical protein
VVGYITESKRIRLGYQDRDMSDLAACSLLLPRTDCDIGNHTTISGDVPLRARLATGIEMTLQRNDTTSHTWKGEGFALLKSTSAAPRREEGTRNRTAALVTGMFSPARALRAVKDSYAR